jgi:hypothetical protein
LPSQTTPATCTAIEALRRQRHTGKQIAAETGVTGEGACLRRSRVVI